MATQYPLAPIHVYLDPQDLRTELYNLRNQTRKLDYVIWNNRKEINDLLIEVKKWEALHYLVRDFSLDLAKDEEALYQVSMILRGQRKGYAVENKILESELYGLYESIDPLIETKAKIQSGNEVSVSMELLQGVINALAESKQAIKDILPERKQINPLTPPETSKTAPTATQPAAGGTP